jgi:hypothetical protein
VPVFPEVMPVGNFPMKIFEVFFGRIDLMGLERGEIAISATLEAKGSMNING